MAHYRGMLLKKTLLIFLFGFLVLFFPLYCWCLNGLTRLDLIGMHASEISSYEIVTPGLAIDGNSKTHWNDVTCTHTDYSFHPWWKVDLGTNHCIGRITLVNRDDVYERLSGAIVRAGIESDILNNSACGSPVTSVQASIPGDHIQFVCDPPLVARYVSVDIPRRKEYLTLCEVMVDEYHMKDCSQTTTTRMATDAMNVDPMFTITSMSTLMFEGKCVADSHPLLSLNIKSPKQCFLSCLMNNECWSFDYVMTSGQCRLYDVKAADLKTDDQPGCLVYMVVRC